MDKAEAIYEKALALPESTQSALLQLLEALADDGTGDDPSRGGRLARTFHESAEIWRRETAFFSFMPQRALHPAYQRIIGMGWAAVPLLLRELQHQPDHWLWALRAITGEEPAQKTDTLKDASQAWLEWGRQRGLLPNGQF